jgi:invasion protein IalB
MPSLLLKANSLAWAIVAFGTSVASAQNTPPSGKTKAAPPAHGQTEIKTFDYWNAGCDPQGEAGSPPRCFARLDVQKSKDDKQLVAILAIAKGKSGEWRLFVQTPTSVILSDGAQLSLGKNAARRLNYVSCEPALCTAEAALDATLQRELTTSEGAKIAFTSIRAGAAWVEFGIKGAKSAMDFVTNQ